METSQRLSNQIIKEEDFSMEQIGEPPPPLPLHLREPRQSKDKIQLVMENKRLSQNKLIRNSILFSTGKLVKVQRDYSSGNVPRFEMEFPATLYNKIHPEEFHNTVDTINNILSQGQGDKAYDFLRFWLDIFTCYTYTQCHKNPLYKSFEQLSNYIEQQNMEVYHKKGWAIKDPSKNGFLYLEMYQLDSRLFKRNSVLPSSSSSP